MRHGNYSTNARAAIRTAVVFAAVFTANVLMRDQYQLIQQANSKVRLFVEEAYNQHAHPFNESNLNAPSEVEAETPFDPPACNPEQLHKIRRQLKPDLCFKSHERPFLNRCSFSYASRCPDTSWLAKHLSQPSNKEKEDPFVSFFVGCNKAIDAIYALRLGSRNPKYDVDKWKNALAQGGEFAPSSCDQFSKNYSLSEVWQPIRDAQVYCFEPVSSTFAELQRAKLDLGWLDELVLEEAAVSSKAGTLSMPQGIALGQEKNGITEWRCGGNKCKEIPIYTLNDYVASMNGIQQIQYLSIDVEGYDFEVLKGASNILKDQVHYLEFEYNWKKPWATQHLEDAIQLLRDFGFICYWPGPKDGEIWRITGCWQDHYALRFWSNVVCVNGQIAEARSLAEDMESNFLRTIDIEGLTY